MVRPEKRLCLKCVLFPFVFGLVFCFLLIFTTLFVRFFFCAAAKFFLTSLALAADWFKALLRLLCCGVI